MATAEQGHQGKGAAQALHRLAHCLLGRHLALEMRRQELRHHLGVGIAVERAAFGHKLVLQFLEILDDAVVHDRHPVRGDGVGIAFRRLAMRGPARVADADRAGQRLLGHPRLEIDQLALGATPVDMAVHQRCNAGRIVAAIFKPLQCFDQQGCNRRLAEDSDDSAHGESP